MHHTQLFLKFNLSHSTQVLDSSAFYESSLHISGFLYGWDNHMINIIPPRFLTIALRPPALPVGPGYYSIPQSLGRYLNSTSFSLPFFCMC